MCTKGNNSIEADESCLMGSAVSEAKLGFKYWVSLKESRNCLTVVSDSSHCALGEIRIPALGRELEL